MGPASHVGRHINAAVFFRRAEVDDHGLAVAEFSPSEIKNSIVGTGRATKAQVQMMVSTLLNLSGDIQADAADALACAVTHAHAMQLTDCDRLAAGKKADLVMIDLHQPNMQPENNLIKNLVYSGSKQNVKLTMVNGQILYENGEFRIGFDPEEIYARSNAIIRRISGSHADN